MVTVELRKICDSGDLKGTVKATYRFFVESPEIEKMLAEGELFGYQCTFFRGAYIFPFSASFFSDVITTFTNYFDEFFRTHEGKYF